MLQPQITGYNKRPQSIGSKAIPIHGFNPQDAQQLQVVAYPAPKSSVDGTFTQSEKIYSGRFVSLRPALQTDPYKQLNFDGSTRQSAVVGGTQTTVDYYMQFNEPLYGPDNTISPADSEGLAGLTLLPLSAHYEFYTAWFDKTTLSQYVVGTPLTIDANLGVVKPAATGDKIFATVGINGVQDRQSTAGNGYEKDNTVQKDANGQILVLDVRFGTQGVK